MPPLELLKSQRSSVAPNREQNETGDHASHEWNTRRHFVFSGRASMAFELFTTFLTVLSPRMRDRALALAILRKCRRIGSHLLAHLASHQISFLPTTPSPHTTHIISPSNLNAHATSGYTGSPCSFHSKACNHKQPSPSFSDTGGDTSLFSSLQHLHSTVSQSTILTPPTGATEQGSKSWFSTLRC